MNQSRFSWNVLKVVVERCSPHGTPLQHLLLSEIACWLSVGWRTKSLHGTWVLHQTSILFKAGLFKVAGMSIWVISFGEKPHQWWTLFCFQKKGKIQNAKKNLNSRLGEISTQHFLGYTTYTIFLAMSRSPSLRKNPSLKRCSKKIACKFQLGEILFIQFSECHVS